jgi:hypothetical protein
MRRLALFAVLVTLAACAGNQDNPTNAHDLRVLGMSFEPPMLFAQVCPVSESAWLDPRLAVLTGPVALTTLIVDPAGEGRAISWDLTACASPGDRTCGTGPSYRLNSGTTGPGELRITTQRLAGQNPEELKPGNLGVPEFLAGTGTPLLQEVITKDPSTFLGGFNMPLVLHLKAGDEEIYAEKLMVFHCKLMPGMAVNHTPIVPGLQLQGESWPEASIPELQGGGPFAVIPEDFTDRLEKYVLPSYTFKPVQLSELWQISWRADLGSFSPGNTGGTGFDGMEVGKHKTEWSPGEGATERDVTFYAVVRDGRGGESWLVRKAHWKP